MEYKVVLTKLPATVKEVTISRWYKQKGDSIKPGDDFFDITAQKLNRHVESEYEGIVADILVEEGSKAKSGEVIAIIEGQMVDDRPMQYADGKKEGGISEKLEADIAILGGGPGGYVAAIVGAKKGSKVVLIEKDSLGGTCLNRGCIPTKALVRASEVYSTVRKAEEFGIHVGDVSIDYKKVKERKDKVVAQLVSGIDALMKGNNIKVVKGEGRLIDKNTIEYAGAVKGRVTAKHIIIATGSRPGLIPIPGADGKNVINSTQFLDMDSLPKTMAIVGGGVIGMEVAFILNNMGVKVNVVEMMDRVLPMCDSEISRELEGIAARRGIKLYLSSKVLRIQDVENGGSLLTIEKDGAEKAIYSEKIFISIGRSLNIENIGLEAVGIEHTRKGICVDEHMRTNIPNIYAIGDVNGKILLAHAASKQGIIAVQNALGDDNVFDSAIPAGIFTDPEIAYVGITEDEAKSKGIRYKTSKFPFAANGKALSYGAVEGFVKLICEDGTNRLLGAHIIGVHATDMVAELTLAVEKGMSADDIADTVLAHPTTAEAIMEAAHSLVGFPIHMVK